MLRFGRLGISALVGFGNFLATLQIDDKSMSEDLLIRRLAIDCHAGQQRGLEPATMLIGRFDVNVSRPMQCWVATQDCFMADAGIDPNIQGVIATPERFWQAKFL